MPKQTKLEVIFALMRRKRGVTRKEIWERTGGYRNFSMEKLVQGHPIRYKKKVVNGRMRYFTKD
jgi:hypothetical protein